MHIRYKLYLGKIREAPIRVPLTIMFEVFLCLSVVNSALRVLGYKVADYVETCEAVF